MYGCFHASNTTNVTHGPSTDNQPTDKPQHPNTQLTQPNSLQANESSFLLQVVQISLWQLTALTHSSQQRLSGVCDGLNLLRLYLCETRSVRR